VQHTATKVVMARKVRWMTSGATSGQELTHSGDTRRSKERGAETNRARAPHYARLQLGVHCRLLRRFPKQ
jgi:hypothetical protein